MRGRKWILMIAIPLLLIAVLMLFVSGQLDNDAWSIIENALTFIAILLASASAYASFKATKSMEEDMETSRRANVFALLESFETRYREQYNDIAEHFGPWPDKSKTVIDPKKRRVVHDLLVSLSAIYSSSQNGIIPEENTKYAALLFSGWLQNPDATKIWQEVFRNTDYWPDGFVEYVDKLLAAPSAWIQRA